METLSRTSSDLDSQIRLTFSELAMFENSCTGECLAINFFLLLKSIVMDHPLYAITI